MEESECCYWNFAGLANEWKNLSAVTGILQDDSSNIVELIRDNYAVSGILI